MSRKPQHAKHAACKKSAKKIQSQAEIAAENAVIESAASQQSDISANAAAPAKKTASEEAKSEKINSRKKISSGSFQSENLKLILLVLASVIFAVSLIVKMPEFVRVLLLILAVAAGGYDIFLSAMNCVKQGEYFATPIIVVFVTVLSFIIGFGAEGAALVLLYKIGIFLIAYTLDKTKQSAFDLLRYQDEESVSKFSCLLGQEDAGHMEIEDIMRSSSGSILKIAMIFAAVYAVALPLITSYSFVVSIHRALMIIIIATPVSVVVSIPAVGIVGLCYSAQQGVFFKNARTLEKAGQCNVTAIDKSGVISSGIPKIVSIKTEAVDRDTFMNFAAHAVYYSEQPVAKAISALGNQEYRLELISDFKDIPGCGVDVKIGGARVTLATSELFAARGVYVPQSDEDHSQVYYLTVSDRYIGKITLLSDINEDAVDMCEGMKDLNLSRCVLFTEDGEEESQSIGSKLDLSEIISGCDTAKKLKLISDLKENKDNSVLYVYAAGFEGHSEADCDIRVCNKAKFADAQVKPEYISNIPFSVMVGRRTREVATSNAVFVFSVKALLIFLSMIGYCNIWFAVFIDMAAALATILNAIRVTNESLIKNFKYKLGK